MADGPTRSTKRRSGEARPDSRQALSAEVTDWIKALFHMKANTNHERPMTAVDIARITGTNPVIVRRMMKACPCQDCHWRRAPIQEQRVRRKPKEVRREQ